jgi:guanylate kinase
MAKERNNESEKDQLQRFQDKVQELIDAGELSPTEADERFEKAVKKISKRNHPSGN